MGTPISKREYSMNDKSEKIKIVAPYIKCISSTHLHVNAYEKNRNIRRNVELTVIHNPNFKNVKSKQETAAVLDDIMQDFGGF